MHQPEGFSEFSRSFRGRLIWPTDANYGTARLVENAAIDRQPALIAQARSVDDVVAAIAFARASQLPLAVRSGGHSVAGHSTGDGVFVLDLSALDRLEIDPATRTAWAEPGVRAGQYTKAAYALGLATPFGDNGNVGIGGITLGGGIGWLVRKHGLTIDSLLAVELVTADGDRLLAGPEEHADLYWAVRGGGGNFGIATRVKLRLHPIDSVLHGMIVLPATRKVMRQLVPLALAAPDELTLMPSVMVIPPMEEIPADQHGRLGVFVGLLWAGSTDSGERAIAPFRALAVPLLDTVAEMPYPAVYPAPSGMREAWTSRAIYLDRLDDETMEIIERRMATAPSLSALTQFRILGGATARVASDATAYGWRDRFLLLWIIADFGNADPGELPRHEAWSASFLDDLRGKGSATYVNFMGDEGPRAVRSAYPPQTWGRLREIKRRYDPTNLFRLNQNILPAPARKDRSPV